ncbi:unnamed protein product [Caenorhabditis bovis]|uniref:DNA helicase n=1 Tax=Caenorhabditis bovis TaxID=2654633 RepID=A0A8S1F215_9PELO|nr:unnamed protein product [Caenorhabditis bovis]
MDLDFDEFGSTGGEALTFVDTDDYGMSVATQDSTFEANSQFTMPTQCSQAESSGLVTGVESNADLSFQDVEDEEEEYNETKENKVPPHACRYCGISDPTCVAKCTVCSKWFCNSKNGTSGSHIVNHMVKSQHKEAYLHEDSPCGDNQLECYICGSKNVFQLGFIPAKTDPAVMILCRSPCSYHVDTKDPSWQSDQWKPLIAEKQLISWIVNTPSEDQVMRARKITASQANRLEEVWKEMPEATLDDLDRPGIDSEPEPVRLRYDDAYQYNSIFHPLVHIEGEYDKKMKASQTQAVGQVRWVPGLRKQYTAYFHMPKLMDGSMKLMKQDLLRLKHTQTLNGSEWSCEGVVIKLPDSTSDEIGMEVKKGHIDKSITETRIMFTCEVVWNSTTFERQYRALDRLVKDESSVSKFIYQKIMGRDVDEVVFKVPTPRRLTAPGLPDLNPSQMIAIRSSLSRPLSLIQGPPGTGKTVTSATVVYHLVAQTQGQVLVCAPSNIAVDHLAEKIHKTGLKVVRLTAQSREDSESTIEFLTLRAQLKTLGNKELNNLIQLKEEIGELSDADHLRFVSLKRVSEHRILAEADVICCTCSTSADPRLDQIRIKTVLIDESTQATEPEVLVPIVRGIRQLILVGDHCQLGPVVMCKKAANAGLQQSLFERLVLLGNRPHRLQVQYRMHPVLSNFPSNVFYEGSLQNGVTENERQMTQFDWQWPVPNMPTMFWSCYGVEEMSASGTSFLNRTEAANVEKLACKLIKGGMSPEQIGVITPYEGQRMFIVNYMHTQGTLNAKLYENMEIASVDAFQGREKDFIIVTCVRSNESSGIGFLNDPRRLNVAITRAKYGLIIIGNAKVLARQPLWHDLLTTYKDRGLVFEGPINNLKAVNIVLPKPTAKIAGSAVKYGIQRKQYTYNEYRGQNQSRGYTEPQNMISYQSQTFRNATANIPVPLSLINPSMYQKNGNAKNSKKQQNRGYSDASQNFFSQASQGQMMAPMPSGAYEGSLSGWSQSQSQAASSSRFGAYTQPMSQDTNGLDQSMANLLLSQDH